MRTFVVAVVVAIVVAVGFALVLNIFQDQQRARFRLKQSGSRPFLRQGAQRCARRLWLWTPQTSGS
jgi:hypothetical protein